jgi:hypothetical protein
MSSAKKDRTEEEGPPRWQPTERYPDPAVEVLDPSFAKYRIFNAAVEHLASGMRWSEGQSGSVAADFCCGATFPTIEL